MEDVPEEVPVSEVPLGKDTLRIYGFMFQFPANAKLEFNPKFKRDDGDVAIKSPERANVFVSWGDLTKVIKKAPTIQDHAKFSLDRVKKSVQGKMTIVETKDITVCGHDAVFNHVKIEVPRRGLFGKGQMQEVTSVHLHCDKTNRFFVIYANATEATAQIQRQTMDGVVESLKCHDL